MRKTMTPSVQAASRANHRESGPQLLERLGTGAEIFSHRGRIPGSSDRIGAIGWRNAKRPVARHLLLFQA
jgi:hypothetical protein